METGSTTTRKGIACPYCCRPGVDAACGLAAVSPSVPSSPHQNFTDGESLRADSPHEPDSATGVCLLFTDSPPVFSLGLSHCWVAGLLRASRRALLIQADVQTCPHGQGRGCWVPGQTCI